jgi:hypothetical protein
VVVGLGVVVGFGVGVGVGVAVGLGVVVGFGVGVGVGVVVGFGVAVGVAVGLGVAVADGLTVGVGVAVATTVTGTVVGVGVGVGVDNPVVLPVELPAGLRSEVSVVSVLLDESPGPVTVAFHDRTPLHPASEPATMTHATTVIAMRLPRTNIKSPYEDGPTGRAWRIPPFRVSVEKGTSIPCRASSWRDP